MTGWGPKAGGLWGDLWIAQYDGRIMNWRHLTGVATHPMAPGGLFDQVRPTRLSSECDYIS